MRPIIALAIAACVGFLMQPDAARAADHLDEDWDVAYYDADGAPTDRRLAVETFAFVRGLNNMVLEVSCNKQNDRFIRIVRRVAPGEKGVKFAGDELVPKIKVLYRNAELYDRKHVAWAFRADAGYYQGPATPRLIDALNRGYRVIIEDTTSDFRHVFSLNGSTKALDEIRCK